MTRRRLWLFRLAALVLVPATVLSILEGGLRLAGIGHDTAYLRRDEVGGRVVLRDNPGFYTLFFPPHLRPVQLPFVLESPKPAGTLRVVLLGGSAAMGIPEPAYGMGPMLEQQLRHRHPGKKIEVIDLANTAINSHVVRRIAASIAPLQPDAFVVYLGNNEVVGPFGAGTVFTPGRSSEGWIDFTLWLRSTRLGQMIEALGRRLRSGAVPAKWRGMEMFVQHRVGSDDPRLATVRRLFARNLEAICDAAERLEIPVVLSTVGVNLRHCGPFASVHAKGLDAAALEDFDATMSAADSAWAAGRLQEARDAYERARSIDARFADVHYRLGRLAFGARDTALARRALSRALEEDALRFRADAAIQETLRSVARERRVVLAPVAETLAAASPMGLPGREFFFEHVHLDVAGNHRTSMVLCRALEAALPARLGPPARPDFLSTGMILDRLGYTPWERARELGQVRAMLDRPPFPAQSDHAEQVARLERELADLQVRLAPDSLAAAWPRVQRAMQADPGDWLPRFRAAQYLTDALDRPAQAEPLWRSIVDELPGFSAALNGLAKCVARQDRFADAELLLRRSLDLDPTQTDVLVNLAYSLRQRSPDDRAVRAEALELERRGLQLEGTAAARERLVQLYLDEARWEASRRATTRARRWLDRAEAIGAAPDRVRAVRRELAIVD